MKWRRTGKNTNLYRSLCSTSDFSIVTDSRFFVDFVCGMWYDKDAGRAVLQPPFFPCSGKIVSCLLVFLKIPRRALCSRLAGAFLCFFGNQFKKPWNPTHENTPPSFLVKSLKNAVETCATIRTSENADLTVDKSVKTSYNNYSE
jgi:hypothetical protein